MIGADAMEHPYAGSSTTVLRPFCQKDIVYRRFLYVFQRENSTNVYKCSIILKIIFDIAPLSIRP